MRLVARERLHPWPRVIAVVLALHLLAGLLLSASPDLHHRLHHDSDTDGHACLVTTIAAGGCEAPPPPVVVVFVMRGQAASWGSTEAVVPAISAARGVLEHAPPQLPV